MPTTPQILYTWHLISGLTHLLLESTYIYNCFTAYTTIPPPSPSPHPNHYFLSQPTRLYGTAYSTSISASPWTEYAKADCRYAGIDITTLSLELITVFLAGPLAIWVAWGLRRERDGGRVGPGTWFWAVVLATGELYGGLMNFLPEWLTGCENLDTENPMHLWLYIVGFNAIWIFFPLWVLRSAYVDISEKYRAVERKGYERYEDRDGGVSDRKRR